MQTDMYTIFMKWNKTWEYSHDYDEMTHVIDRW